MTSYEYGIKHHRSGDAHREGMSLKQAQDWLDVWLEDGGNKKVFSIIRRQIGEWELLPEEEQET